MYNIIQLNDKNLSELQADCQRVGSEKGRFTEKRRAGVSYPDEQAIVGATKKSGRTAKTTEERKEGTAT